jgi:hypothetical protein
MRLVAILLLASAMQTSAAVEHRCTAPLVLAYDAELPEPELAFDLLIDTKADPLSFSGTGQYLAKSNRATFQWTGHWIDFDDSLQLIGTARFSDETHEWRAEGKVVHDGVMMLNLERETDGPLMVRCLTGEWK